MPVSKRNRVISLTQAKKKGLEHKEKLVEEIRNAIEKYNSLYIFSVENMRNNKLKDVREEWKGSSKLIMGKNKVLQVALGRNRENEIADNIHKVSERLLGQCGLLLTSQPEDEVIEWFDSYRESDFARAGFVATKTVTLKDDDLVEFVHSMEPQFRRLGLPTKLVNGKIKLLQEFTVCNEGDTLTPEMADVLKHVGVKMADFHVTLEFVWRKDGSFKVLHEKEERSLTGVKKSKSKTSKAKRFKKSNPAGLELTVKGDNDEAMEQDDDDDDDDGDSSEEGDEDLEDEEEPAEAPTKQSTKEQKENRVIKKAKRSIPPKKSAGSKKAAGGDAGDDDEPTEDTNEDDKVEKMQTEDRKNKEAIALRRSTRRSTRSKRLDE